MLTLATLIILVTVPPALPQTKWASEEARITHIIEEQADIWGVDPYIALRVAYCESNGEEKVKNSGSSAGGLFQITIDTWNEAVRELNKEWLPLDRYEAEKNAYVAMYLMSEGDMWRWNASINCWK